MLGGYDPSRSVTKGRTMSTEPADRPAPGTVIVPDDARLVRLCREVFNDEGIECGKKVIAWALTVDCGPTVTVEADPNRRICVWDNLTDAVQSLDTFIDGPYNRYPVVAG